MGGFVYNPPPPETGATPAPAPDVPPAGALDFAQAAQGVSQGFDWGAFLKMLQPLALGMSLDMHAAKKAFDKSQGFTNAKALEDYIIAEATKFGDVAVDIVVQLLAPFRAIFANLSAHYVQTFAADMQGGDPNKIPTGAGATVATTAAGAFDGICAPLGFMGGGNPEEAGAGHAAVQKVLGTLVSLHLNTWVVNVLSNLTGLGFLHYINSFDDVILSAMNTRAMGRLAFKPYMDTYMVAPLTRDLNIAHPLKWPAPTTVVRAYNAGQLTNTAFLALMREAGYSEQVAANYLTEIVKHPSAADVAWLVNTGVWTDEQGQAQLELDGYSSQFSGVILERAKLGQSDAIARRIIDECISEVADHLMPIETAEQIIEALDIPRFEEDLYIQLMNLLYHRPRKLSYAQVLALYKASLMTLDDVAAWLESERYTSDDARNLMLLDFTEATQLSAHQAQLGAMYRVRSVTYAQKATADLAKANQTKATAEQALADKYAALASKYGG
jgi:hypothetical protein